MGGDNIFNSRAIFGFLKGKGINQNSLIWDGGGNSLKLSQKPMCGRSFP
jgi:hypothetical protein